MKKSNFLESGILFFLPIISIFSSLIFLVNENIGMNKMVKTKSAKTLRNYLYEFMGFDITESVQSRLQFESSKVEELKKQAASKMKEIKTFESKLDRMNVLKKQTLNEEQLQLLDEILEELKNEILVKKEEYKNIIDVLSEAEETEETKETTDNGKKEEPEIPFEVGDSIKHKPSGKKGKVTACANKLTCTVKFEDNKIETCKIEDCTKTEDIE